MVKPGSLRNRCLEHPLPAQWRTAEEISYRNRAHHGEYVTVGTGVIITYVFGLCDARRHRLSTPRGSVLA